MQEYYLALPRYANQTDHPLKTILHFIDIHSGLLRDFL